MTDDDRSKLARGYVHVYTGDGKGKTTAAIGLAIRAAGAGLNVLFAQFIKGAPYSETRALTRFDDRVTVKQFGRGRFIKGKPDPEDVKLAQDGLAKCQTLMSSGQFDLIILDEANVAVDLGLFTINALLDVINAKPENVELVLTGRGAKPELLDKADLVTEMRAVKHYHDQGVLARKGIES